MGWLGHGTASVTIAADATASLGVTNFFLRNFANLVISKVVTGSGYTGTAADFTVSWDCGAPYQGSQAIAAGASTPPIQVPAGVACNIIETPPAADLLAPGYVWLDPVFDGFNSSGEIVIPEGGTGTVTVTNPNELAYSRIVVQKEILDNASAVLPGTTFTVNVSCAAPAQGEAADYSEDFTLTWPDTIVAVSDYLPIATSCTVSEVDLPSGSDGLTDASYAWGPAPAPQDVEVPASTTPTPVTVTNTITRVTAPFGIVKSVVNTFPVTADGPFSGEFSCTYAGDAAVTGTWTRTGPGAATLTTAGGSSAETVEVLVGSSCTATESAAAGPVWGDPSYTWSIQPRPRDRSRRRRDGHRDQHRQPLRGQLHPDQERHRRCPGSPTTPTPSSSSTSRAPLPAAKQSTDSSRRRSVCRPVSPTSPAAPRALLTENQALTRSDRSVPVGLRHVHADRRGVVLDQWLDDHVRHDG